MAEDYTKRKGVRHIDRLLQVLLAVAEDTDQDARTRLEASKQALTVLQRRNPPKRDKKKEAIEKMIGKKQSP